MKIAMRKTNAPGFFPGLFNNWTKWSLHTEYSHGGVLIGDQLWHTTTKGVLPETLKNPELWDLFETNVPDTIALERCMAVLGQRYDLISLLGFKIPIRITDSRGLYCFELQWLAMTGEHPKKRVSPDTVMAEILRGNNAKSNSARDSFVVDHGSNRELYNSIGAAPESRHSEPDLSSAVFADLCVHCNINLGFVR